MSMSRPETGEKFGHAKYAGTLTYVGTLTNKAWWVLETVRGTVAVLSPEEVQGLYPYLEPVEPLERGQLFKRTRHDYTGMVAEVLAVFPGQRTYSGDEVFESTWVAYHQHGGSGGDREPRLKDETSFRRIFGRRAESVARPVT